MLDALQFGGSVLTAANYNNFVFFSQVDYFEFDSDNLDDHPPRARLETDSLMAAAAVGYRFHTFGEHSTLDVLGGARYANLDNTLTLGELGSDDASQDIWDGIVMFRPSLELLSWLRLNPTFAVGTGTSDITYELQPEFQFLFGENISMRLGCRRLFYRVTGDRGNEFDGAFHGLVAGVGVEF